MIGSELLDYTGIMFSYWGELKVGTLSHRVEGMIRFDPTVIEAKRAAWVDAWNKAIAK